MSQILDELEKYASEGRKNSNEWFFKTGVGEYGEGDKFIGVTNPNVRIVCKKYFEISLEELKLSLSSPIHEERLTALLILVLKYQKTKDITTKKRILEFYLSNIKFVNNWDLVDSTAAQILGNAILLGLADESILDSLARSKSIWERRVSIISTLSMIRGDKFNPTIRISKKLLHDKEDLIHKAVGWALRELWKKDSAKCEEFLLKNYPEIPRTTLRYAIEKMPEDKRKTFLKLKNSLSLHLN